HPGRLAQRYFGPRRLAVHSGDQSSHSIGAPLIMYAAASTAGHHTGSTGPSGLPGAGSKSAACRAVRAPLRRATVAERVTAWLRDGRQFAVTDSMVLALDGITHIAQECSHTFTPV